MEPTTTLDGLLNHRIKIEQPAKGYRVAVDTLLLAAAVPAEANDNVLDLGCGVGGAMLALACRVPDVHVTGIEIQPELARLCLTNIERNTLPLREGRKCEALSGRGHVELHVVEGDATHFPAELANTFDHVMMNPPYHDEARHDASANEIKRLANTEAEGDLALWIDSAATALRDGGILTLIHRADRRDEITNCLKASFGALRIKPIMTKPDGLPKRIIVRAGKGAMWSETNCSPLIMHQADGGYTPDANAILRDVGALGFERR